MADTNQPEYRPLTVNTQNLRKVLVGETPLDFKAFYDVKTPAGREFVGARVFYETRSDGGGLGSVACLSYIPFFDADDGDLVAKLQDGYQMRVNPEVTAQKHQEASDAAREKERARLEKQKADTEAALEKLK